MRRLRGHADRAEGEPNWIERPEVGRRAGKLHVDRQRHVIVERDPVLAGTDRARQIEMAVHHDRLELRGDVLHELLAALLAVQLEHAGGPSESVTSIATLPAHSL